MRESISVEEACLTILLSVQPVVIGELMSNKKFRNRGLTARFLYTAPASLVGTRQFNAGDVSEEVGKAYKDLLYNMLSEERGGEARIIRLSDEAREVLTAFHDWVEVKLKSEYSMYGDWLGKLVGNTLRIAGILSRCGIRVENEDDALFAEKPDVTIDAHTLRAAIRIARYFLIHAVYAYGEMGVKGDFKAALAVLDTVRQKNLNAVTRRDVMRICRWVSNAEESQHILDQLEDFGYLKLVSVDESDKLRGGRPKNAVYSVNPAIFAGKN